MIELKGQVKHIRLTGRLMIDPAGRMEPSLQDKTATPTAAEQIIEPDPGFDGLSSLTIVGDENFIPKNIKMGVKIWGIEGIYAGALPIVASASAELVPIYEGTARSLGIDANNMNFDSHATGILYEETQ